MATMEMTIEEELEEVSSPADSFASVPRELDLAALEPWKNGSDPETPADADWLFEILMA
jgi:hypothetical protein